jgi:hypothetical protein
MLTMRRRLTNVEHRLTLCSNRCAARDWGRCTRAELRSIPTNEQGLARPANRFRPAVEPGLAGRAEIKKVIHCGPHGTRFLTNLLRCYRKPHGTSPKTTCGQLACG